MRHDVNQKLKDGKVQGGDESCFVDTRQVSLIESANGFFSPHAEDAVQCAGVFSKSAEGTTGLFEPLNLKSLLDRIAGVTERLGHNSTSCSAKKAFERFILGMLDHFVPNV